MSFISAIRSFCPQIIHAQRNALATKFPCRILRIAQQSFHTSPHIQFHPVPSKFSPETLRFFTLLDVLEEHPLTENNADLRVKILHLSERFFKTNTVESDRKILKEIKEHTFLHPDLQQKLLNRFFVKKADDKASKPAPESATSKVSESNKKVTTSSNTTSRRTHAGADIGSSHVSSSGDHDDWPSSCSSSCSGDSSSSDSSSGD